MGISLMEQLAIVAKEATKGAQVVLMYVCLGIYAALGLGIVLGYMLKVFTPAIVWMKRHKLDTLFVAPFVICCVYVGSTKHTGGSVTFPFTDVDKRYLYDAGSYVTNDMVHVAWTRSPVVPSSADFWGAVRPVGNTNDEDWVVFMGGTFDKIISPTNIPYAGAQTNNFQFFTTWTPGPTVHTNGVAVIMWQMDYNGTTNKFLTYRTGIYTNGFRIAPNANITNGPPVEATLTITTTNAAESEEE